MGNHILILVVLSILYSCDFGNAGEEQHIIGKYYVGWADMETNRSIYMKETPQSNSGGGVVSGYVFAIGNNSRYIIAKTLDSPTFKSTNYHIIDTKGYQHSNINNYWHFYSEAEFQQKLETLNISSIKFDKNYRKDPWQ